MESWVQLPPTHRYASPRTMKVRGSVQLISSTSEGRDWTYFVHECSGQETALVGGSGMDRDTEGRHSKIYTRWGVWRVGRSVGNGRVGVQDSQPYNIGTSLLTRCAAMYHKTPLGVVRCAVRKRVQMTQTKRLNGNLLMFGQYRYLLVHLLKTKN